MREADKIVESFEANQALDLGLRHAEELSRFVSEVVGEPIAADAFIWLATVALGDQAGEAALWLINQSSDPGMLYGISLWFAAGGDLPPELRKRVVASLIDQADNGQRDSSYRGYALYCALHIARCDRPSMLRLQAALLEIDDSDDGEFLRRASRVIGFAHAAHPVEELRRLLERLSEVDGSCADAAMELGLDCLRSALEETIRTSAVALFEHARSWFARASAVDDRLDAVFYVHCLDLLLLVNGDEFAGDLTSRVVRIRETAFQLAALSSHAEPYGDAIVAQLGLARSRWALLAVRLGALHESFKKPIWMRAATVIEEELISIFAASRTILGQDRDGGVESALRPFIVNHLRTKRRHFEFLDAWIDENKGSPLLPDASAMRDALNHQWAGSVRRHPPDAAGEPPSFTAVMSAGGVTKATRAEALARLTVALAAAECESNPVVQELIDGIFDELNGSKDFLNDESIRDLFTALVWLATLFVVWRQNVGRSTDRHGAYLFERDDRSLPGEKALQLDFLQYVSSSPLAGCVNAEVSDIAGGRADLLFSHRGASTVAEVKRVTKDYTHGELVEEFGAQAVSYQTTNVPISLLLVLDLTRRCGGQPHLREQISVQRKMPNGSATEHVVIVFRVQGRRNRPSALT
jgi:hypothetical protein